MCIKREARNNGKRTNLQSDCLLEKKKKRRERKTRCEHFHRRNYLQIIAITTRKNINAFLDENTHPLCKRVKNSNAHYR